MANYSDHFSNRILLITWNFPPKRGGMENLIYDIYKHLSSEYEIDVIAPHGGDKTDNIYRPKQNGFLYFIIFSILKSCTLIYKKKHKYLFGGSLTILPVLTVLKLLFQIKSIAYAHGLDIIFKNRIYQVMLRLCIPFMNGFICNSQNTKNILKQNFPRAKNITVIPPGLDMEKYNIQTERPYSRKYILSVGRLTERKGLIQFIENSFIHIANKFPDVDFVIIGDEPKEAMYHKIGYKQKVIECINRLGLQNKVILYGWVEESDKLAFFQYCECLVFPVIPAENDVEGFGIVAIETGVMGRPTVAFDVGGISDAIINNISGCLVTVGDYFHFTSEIENVIQKTDISPNKEIVENIINNYSWSYLIPKYSNYLFSL